MTLYDYVGEPRPEKAHVVIRRLNTGISASNDIGFLKQQDGTYKAIVSEYDQSSLFIDDGHPVQGRYHHRSAKTFLESVKDAYKRLNADKQVQRIIQTQIPQLRLQGLIPAHATVHRETVGQQIQVKVKW